MRCIWRAGFISNEATAKVEDALWVYTVGTAAFENVSRNAAMLEAICGSSVFTQRIDLPALVLKVKHAGSNSGEANANTFRRIHAARAEVLQDAQ